MEIKSKESKKITKREFLKKTGEAIVGAAVVGAIYKVVKDSAKRIIENAPEGIYYLLTGEKKQIESIDEKNYQDSLNFLKEKLKEKLKVETEIKTFKNIDEGINKISFLLNDSTIILVLWPTKKYPKYEPSLGIVLEARRNYLKVWDPNHDVVEYFETLDVWREENRPLVFLLINKKLNLDLQRQKDIVRAIKEFRQNI